MTDVTEDNPHIANDKEVQMYFQKLLPRTNQDEIRFSIINLEFVT
jgi:hypothetical protein